MTTDPNAGDDRALFVADFYPKLGEYLAERHASGYDAVAARARFVFWLAAHVEDRPAQPRGRPAGGWPWSVRSGRRADGLPGRGRPGARG